MSIKIEFEAATGADLRKEMLDLLGIGQGFIGVDISRAGQDKSVIATVEDGVVTDVKEVETPAADETPKPDQPTRTRRSKAQIEAETKALAANTGTEEPPASTENVEVSDTTEALAQDNVEQNGVTAEDLTKKCVELGREGKRNGVIKLFETQFGGATISKKDGKPQLTAEQYPAVMEALNDEALINKLNQSA